MNLDPYQILGVAKSATHDEIRAAYRKLVKELHPDVRPDDKGAEERFKRVASAFELLSDPDKRARFDRGEIDGEGRERAFRREGAGPFDANRGPQRGRADSFFDLDGIFDDLFSQGFGQQRPQGQRGKDVRFRLSIDFLDAVNGGRRRIALGDGKVIDVAIPAGVESGRVLRLKAQGEPGLHGGPPGDALVELVVSAHAFFRREGDDIHLDLPISLTEAVEGARIEAPTIRGKVLVSVPPGSNSGEILRLRGMGVGETAGPRAGDQLLHLKIQLPEGEDEELKKFLKKWANRGFAPDRPKPQ